MNKGWYLGLGTATLALAVLAFSGMTSGMPAGAAATPEEPATGRPESGIDNEGAVSRRQAFFGDLHVHSSLSFDSYIDMNRNSPEEAYDFARGKPVRLAEDGPILQLRLPLDFMALTDHSEYFGEMRICTDPRQKGFSSDTCEVFRDKLEPDTAFNRWAAKIATGNATPFPFCADTDCRAVADEVWRDVQRLAYDRYEPGKFTTFVGYEWSASPEGGSWRSVVSGDMVHRNVIFRDQNVIPRAISTFDAKTPEALWRRLQEECRPPCRVMAIPHNPNYSSGYMFDADELAGDRELAELRAEMERVVEIMQTKGESECKRGVGNDDEACAFENLIVRPVCPGPDGDLEAPDCVPLCVTPGQAPGGGPGSGIAPDCVWPQDYLRNALKEGLRLERALGTNPFKLGFIGSTDTHNGAPGSTVEEDFLGQHADKEVRAVDRLELPTLGAGAVIKRVVNNPGGLAGVWAEDNTREAIFDALSRRETFATSGTRLRPLLFGGWSGRLPADACAAGDPAAVGYRHGVPMGGDLPARPGSEAKPRFVTWAMKAPDSVGLARLQVVKGWIDDGEVHERPLAGEPPATYRNVEEAVYDVSCAGGARPDPETHRCPPSGASVNVDTCEPTGRGASDLCQVWTDEDFDPERPAFYYLRVLENPTCRWSTYDCNRLIDTTLGEHCALYAELQLPPCQPSDWPQDPVIVQRLRALDQGSGSRLEDRAQVQLLRDTAACCCPLIPRTVEERAWTSPIWYRPVGAGTPPSGPGSH